MTKKKRKFSIIKKRRSCECFRDTRNKGCPEYFILTRPSRREEKDLEGTKERRQVAAQVCRTFQLVAGLFFAIAADAAVHYC